MSLFTVFCAVLSVLILVVFIREVLRRVTSQRQCPICGDAYPDRIKRPAWLKSMQFLLSSARYQCHACGNRFIQLGQSSAKALEDSVMH
ncbi:hypothetical protein [Spirosoma fluviale]|uniref:Uncharacterized protein n=1 Tax=Spirosoma fluviale TaxID=1597977 RepID=A0A286G5R5_9BACT|nr:hypothetical protein [Spirosoma fluviale]SOD90324.1 hypothetical protein SAMN06269250_3377 [Spirosoma fluviale]